MCCASCAWTCPSCPTCPITAGQGRAAPGLRAQRRGLRQPGPGRRPSPKAARPSSSIRFDALDLSPMWAYLPATLPVRPVGGRLGADLTLRFEQPQGSEPRVELKGRHRSARLQPQAARRRAAAGLAAPARAAGRRAPAAAPRAARCRAAGRCGAAPAPRRGRAAGAGTPGRRRAGRAPCAGRVGGQRARGCAGGRGLASPAGAARAEGRARALERRRAAARGRNAARRHPAAVEAAALALRCRCQPARRRATSGAGQGAGHAACRRHAHRPAGQDRRAAGRYRAGAWPSPTCASSCARRPAHG